MDNIIAVIIFIVAIAAIVGLIIYRKKKNNESISVDDLLNSYNDGFIQALKDVIELLSINIDSFETKEDYERAIISTTIDKLEENCSEFGISSVLFKVVDKNTLTNVLYDIFYTNKIQVFFDSLTKKEVKDRPDLYDEEVIEAVESGQYITTTDEVGYTEVEMPDLSGITDISSDINEAVESDSINLDIEFENESTEPEMPDLSGIDISSNTSEDVSAASDNNDSENIDHNEDDQEDNIDEEFNDFSTIQNLSYDDGSDIY